MKSTILHFILLCMFAAGSLSAQTFYKPSGFTLEPEMGHAMASTSDGGAILASYDPGYDAIFVVKTDINNNPVWDFTYRMAGQNMIPNDILVVGSHGYLICGRSLTWPFAPMRLMIGTSGNVLWSKRPAANKSGVYYKSYYDFSNDKIVSVGTVGYGSNTHTFLVSSIRPNGTAAIDQVINLTTGSSTVGAFDVTRAFDGGLIVVGSRNVYPDPDDRVYVIKLAPTSYAVQWVKEFKDDAGAFSMQVTSVTGHYDLFGGQHGYVIGGRNLNTPTILLPDEGFLFRIRDNGSLMWARSYVSPVQDVISYWYGGIHATGTDDESPYIAQINIGNGQTLNYKEYGHQFNSSTQSEMEFTELQLRFNPGSFYPAGLRAGGYYTVGTDRLVDMKVDFSLKNACSNSGKLVSDYNMGLSIEEPEFSQITLGYPSPLNFYRINRNAVKEDCANLIVSVSGATEECHEYIGMFPIILQATSSHNDVTFSWQAPPGFSGFTSGANNQFFHLTGAPAPPLYGSFTDFFQVTANYNLGTLTATTSHAFTVIYCDGEIRKWAGEAVESPKVFPNPASEAVSVLIPSEELPATVQIVNLEGQVLKTASASDIENRIDLEGLAQGLYFIEIQGALGRHTEKLVVK